MGDGRTVWWAKDAVWYDREFNVILGHEFGAEGTTVMDVLSCMAKLENNAGQVKTGYHSLTKKGNISDEDVTRAIVARAVTIGALDDFTEDRLTFTARVSGWKADQDLARAAVRQDRARATAADRDNPLRTVTKRDEPLPTGQYRTEQTEQSSVKINVEPDRLDVASSRLKANAEIAEAFAYWQERCGHPKADLSPKRRRNIAARLKEQSLEVIRTAIDGAARAAHVDDNGVKHDDIELICRSPEKLDLFVKRASSSAAARPGKQSPADLWHQINGEHTAADPDITDAEVVEESA